VRGGARGSVSTDSRAIRPGQWFVALSGDNFDGHRFLEDAARAGCAGAVSSQPAPEGWSAGYVLVDDAMAALQRLAADVRDRFDGPVAGPHKRHLFSSIKSRFFVVSGTKRLKLMS